MAEYWSGIRSQKNEILNVRADAARRRGLLEQLIARAGHFLARPGFFAAELIFHTGWILANTGVIPGVVPWDPFPFSFLTGLASAQALIIGLLILMYEERSARIAEIRDETALQVALHAERETTKLIRLVLEVQAALGVRTTEPDEEIAEMAEPLDPGRLRHTTEEVLREADDA